MIFVGFSGTNVFLIQIYGCRVFCVLLLALLYLLKELSLYSAFDTQFDQ